MSYSVDDVMNPVYLIADTYPTTSLLTPSILALWHNNLKVVANNPSIVETAS